MADFQEANRYCFLFEALMYFLSSNKRALYPLEGDNIVSYLFFHKIMNS